MKFKTFWSGAFALIAVMFFSLPVMAGELVINGDFEDGPDTFVVWPGYAGNGNPDSVPGWTNTGGVGMNPVNDPSNGTPAPFRDNGDNDTGVTFMQGVSTLEQLVSGFNVGQDYILALDFNSRNCCGDVPVAIVSLNGIEVGNTADLFPAPGGVIPVGGAEPWYHADIPFTALTSDITLLISSESAAGGDATFILDNVSIMPVPEPSTFVLGALGLLSLLTLAAGRRKK